MKFIYFLYDIEDKMAYHVGQKFSYELYRGIIDIPFFAGKTVSYFSGVIEDGAGRWLPGGLMRFSQSGFADQEFLKRQLYTSYNRAFSAPDAKASPAFSVQKDTDAETNLILDAYAMNGTKHSRIGDTRSLKKRLPLAN